MNGKPAFTAEEKQQAIQWAREQADKAPIKLSKQDKARFVANHTVWIDETSSITKEQWDKLVKLNRG